ncbi:hypothetical protein [Glutamicibacter sp.]
MDTITRANMIVVHLGHDVIFFLDTVLISNFAFLDLVDYLNGLQKE